jgi:catechol 2,3-dioxygenase-like lactoylglutathione lyase family enzyme
MMLKDAPAAACVIVKDLDAAKEFYTEKLGLTVVPSEDPGGILFEAGEGSKIFVYQSNAEKPKNTVAGFAVSDVLEAVNELKEKGVKFESYDFDPIKTDENNIARTGDYEAAWFTDPEGNIFGISNGNAKK